ncbi:phosphatidate phosphatase APP1 [Ceratobasidium sp. AG-Ba]|nr:phosphatidate phosphatase APP1 [Ceratobasidium sp. AG-Ba]QRW02863.1 phosphatidate phosphatase APP1 [Ceratobasidium sp. AG-Ba]
MSGPSRPGPGTPQSSFTMSGGGWRNAALSKLAKVRDYVASSEVSKSAYNAVSNRVVAYRTGIDPVTGEKRQTWEEWAREKRQRRREEQRGTERISLFPGWAVRRYPDTGLRVANGDVQEFSIDLFVSGFVSSLRTPDQATRSQKAFMRIARGFSALPKLPPPPDSILSGPGSVTPLTQSPGPSTDDLSEELARMGIVLPPRPEEITDESEAHLLTTLPQPRVETNRDSRIVDFGVASSQSELDISGSSRSGRAQPPPLPARSPTITGPTLSPTPSSSQAGRSNAANSVYSVFSATSSRSGTDFSSVSSDMDTGVLRQLHANLDARLQPFWCSKLENRTVQLSVYAHPVDTTPRSDPGILQEDVPLARMRVQTGSQGYFSHTFNISFEQLCTHDRALQIAFGSHMKEQPLYIHAELLPVPNAPMSNGLGAEASQGIGVEDRNSQPDGCVQARGEWMLSAARVRVISDIDDTIKISEVLMGVRAIFHNVFVRHLDELVVPGMSEFYSKLSERGVRFHYVSNGPFELLPVLIDFLGISNLPKGSVKLKSYGGRNLFQGLWGESAADRKRGNVIEVLDSFPESKFILVGDTGEQDLELYSTLAQERPYQIIALFLRDVTPATPPPTAPSTPTLGPVSDGSLRKKGSASSLRSVRSLTGGGKKTKEEVPKIQIPRAAPNSAGPVTARSATRSVTDPIQSPSVSTAYRVYTPRSRGSSGSYFDGPTPTAKRAELPSISGQFSSANLDLGMDPASALVSAAATAGTGHSADAVADNTRAGILAKKEALRLRIEAARARTPAHIKLRIFREPYECEAEAMQVLDDLQGR